MTDDQTNQTFVQWMRYHNKFGKLHLNISGVVFRVDEMPGRHDCFALTINGKESIRYITATDLIRWGASEVLTTPRSKDTGIH